MTAMNNALIQAMVNFLEAERRMVAFRTLTTSTSRRIGAPRCWSACFHCSPRQLVMAAAAAGTGTGRRKLPAVVQQRRGHRRCTIHVSIR